ncbi:unnamed protein product [Leptosia nina]|uniref:C2H2-type domain-containing protein n=1 Tax=Leptosia nina TaxID=320188 RepID=A0AAV1JZZ2_9NEOP
MLSKKKRERQQRYREQNRDKLKQREAERRRRLQNADVITELSTSPNIELTEKKCEPSRDEIPMSMLQQRIRERDPTYMKDSNIFTIVEYSYACPFKCRHNNILCFYCGSNFTDPAQLRDHTVNAHNPKKFNMSERTNSIKLDLTRIDCRLCPTKINNLDDFKQHITAVHKKKYYSTIRDFILPFRLSKEDTKCALCDRTFPYFHALNRHMNEHFSNFVCEQCGLGFVDRNRFVMHRQKHESGRFPCEVCGKEFRVASYKDIHVDRVHNKRGRVFCPKCDVILMSYPQKLKHLVEVHGETPLSFTCNICNQVFETRRNFTIHKRKVHLKDFRYECQCCGQKFFTRAALTNHMPVHTGERNFKCKYCEKSYPRLKTLKDHIRIHTNDRRKNSYILNTVDGVDGGSGRLVPGFLRIPETRPPPLGAAPRFSPLAKRPKYVLNGAEHYQQQLEAGPKFPSETWTNPVSPNADDQPRVTESPDYETLGAGALNDLLEKVRKRI